MAVNGTPGTICRCIMDTLLLLVTEPIKNDGDVLINVLFVAADTITCQGSMCCSQ